MTEIHHASTCATAQTPACTCGAVAPPAPPTPRWGDRVRCRCTATGRYLGNGLALFVSAMCNELCIDDLAADPWDVWEDSPVPTNRELEAASEGLRYAQLHSSKAIS